MKLIKTITTLIIIAFFGIAIVTTCPSIIYQWYVEQNQTGLGFFFDDAFIVLVEQQTASSDHLVFSIFELNGQERYVRIFEQFFGKNSIERTTENFQELLRQAKEKNGGYQSKPQRLYKRHT